FAVADRLLARALSQPTERQLTLAFLGLTILFSLSCLGTTWRNHDWRSSLAIYGDAARKSPAKPRALINYGIALLNSGQPEEAVRILEKAIALGRPGYEDYLKAGNNILVEHLRRQDYQGAIERGTTLLAEMPPGANAAGLPRLLLNLGHALLRTDRFVEARRAFLAGLRQDPREVYLLVVLEQLYRAAGQTEEGRRQLSLTGEEFEPLVRVARDLAGLREYPTARRYLAKVLVHEPGHEEATAVAAELDALAAANEKARELSAGEPPGSVRSRLGRSLVGTSRFIMARYRPLRPVVPSLLSLATRLDPDSPWPPLVLARWHLAAGQPQAAQAVIAAALPRREGFPPFLEAAVDTCQALGDTKRAAATAAHLLDLYPGHPDWERLEHLSSQAGGQGDRPPAATLSPLPAAVPAGS
ncbi:MAG: tetratricopeptide repeat protein, partial [Thermodesulfobacteriota bacterium]